MSFEKARIQQHANDQKGKTFFVRIAILLQKCIRNSSKHIIRILFASPCRTLSWLLLCTAIALFIPASKPLFQQDYPDTLRVVSPQNQRVFASLSPFGIGFEYDLVNLFASNAGYAVQWLHENDAAAAMTMVENNKADLVVGFPEVNSALSASISRGPVYTHGQSVSFQLHDKTIAAHKAKVEAQEQNQATDQNSNQTTNQATDQTSTPFQESSTRQTQYAEELYEGESIITDEISWALWQPFARQAGTVSPLDTTTNYSWYWNVRNDKLGAQVLQFWRARNQLGDSVLADLNEQYFNFIPVELDTQELEHLQRVMKTRLPRYQKYIDAAAKRYHIDPLLLTAVIFQESHFDPNAVSYTGVRGIMQLTQSTADSLGVDRLNPQQSIEGGARYLRQIWDSLVDVGMGEEHRNDKALDSATTITTATSDATNTTGPDLTDSDSTLNADTAPSTPSSPLSPDSLPLPTPAVTASTLNSVAPELIGLTNWNRWCFTLAAFNQGRGHLRDAIRLAKALGGTGLTWHELRSIYPLMSQKAFYSKLRYGRCRGDEAVQFVDNIRWYYYILSGSAFLNGLKS